MSSGLTSTLSEYSKRSEFAKNPLAAESASGPAAQTSKPALVAGLRRWLGRLASSAFARYLLAFILGAVAMLAWQSYGNAARKTIAGWSPRLAWMAPAAASHGISPDRIRATALALAAVHQSVDKLATQIGRLEAQGADSAASPPPSRRRSRRP